MNCEKCGGKTEVIASKQIDNFGDPIRKRRHVCPKCENRFTTYEIRADGIEKYKKFMKKADGMVPISKEQYREMWNRLKALENSLLLLEIEPIKKEG